MSNKIKIALFVVGLVVVVIVVRKMKKVSEPSTNFDASNLGYTGEQTAPVQANNYTNVGSTSDNSNQPFRARANMARVRNSVNNELSIA